MESYENIEAVLKVIEYTAIWIYPLAFDINFYS